MTLKERIVEEMKAAMREKDAVRLESIRLLRAAIQRREVDDRVELDDDEVLAVVQKLVKQGRDSITQFEAGGRPDLVEKEASNIAVLETYLPEQLSGEELARAVEDALQEAGATSIREMGKVMGALKQKLQGRADMGAVSALVKQRLS
ncbi:MAG: GatB/YqeY domain-containing protein [Pseudomonadota bacterium]|nr:GatB/YqeY domain-containing protein [Pseudomonadota bacterium]